MSFGIPVRNGLGVGLLASTFLSTLRIGGRPAMFLNFIGTDSLDSRVTFTRASTATFVGSNGSIQSAAINTPRFDYDPVTLAPKGLLLEEARTNSLPNNTMVGAAAGSPGTAPTGWFPTSTGGVFTRTIVGVGVENGIDYIDIRYQASGAGVANVQFVGGTVIAGSNGQNWTFSSYVKLVGGSLTNVAVANSLIENSASGSFLAGGDSATYIPTTASLISQRRTYSRTNTNALTAYVYTRTRVEFSGAGDVTLRFGLPQLELGAFATSVVQTSTVAVTRSADVAQMTGTNFSSWYNQTEGTFVLSGDVISNITDRLWMDVGPNGAFGTTAYISQNSSSISLLPGSPPVNLSSTVVTSALSNNVAIALQNNNSVIAVGGVLGTVDAACAVPASATQLVIGSAIWALGSTITLNGHIRRIAYYNTRLPNATLQALTA